MATTIQPMPAEAGSASSHAPGARPVPGARALELSRPLYWALSFGIVALYLAVWLSHFQYVYGVMSDDYFALSPKQQTFQLQSALRGLETKTHFGCC